MTTDRSHPGHSVSAPRSEEELIEAALRQESGPPMGPGLSRPLPDRIGPYQVLRELGAGGMGVVYEARQEQPIRRRVALKVIKLGMDTRTIVARFEAERQALAMMDHPNIAKVFDAGVTEHGQPYFAMEYVQGVRFTEYCDRQRLTTAERLGLFVHVCQAIQHAHQKGIIHRDIKPSNVLVAMPDDTPVPKVIDFGVAKATAERLTEKTLFTQQGQFVGTPEYMSPEQAGLEEQDIDTRTDVYSLGVLLYELLVGVLPYGPTYLRSRGVAEIQRIIREEEPPKPSTRLSGRETGAARCATQRGTAPHVLRRQLRGELDWITMKALEKDRARRYDSPAGLAADIQRHLKHEPVLAGPPSAAYRFHKFVRRNRGLVTGAAVVLVVLMAGIVASTVFAVGEARARREARWLAYLNSIRAAAAALSDSEIRQLHERLDEAPEEYRDWEWRYLDTASDQSLAILRGHQDMVLSVTYSPDRKRLASGAFDHTVRIWDVASGEELAGLAGHTAGVYSVAFSPDGKRLASGADDHTVRIWDVANGKEVAILEGHTHRIHSVAYSPNGKRLASGADDNTVRIWDAASGRVESILEHESLVRSAAFSPDSERLVSTSWSDMTMHIWEASTGEQLADWRAHNGGVRSVAFSPDGSLMATGSQDQTACLWDASTGEQQAVLYGHTGEVCSVAFSPDRTDARLASASTDATVRLWSVTTGASLAVLRGHEEALLSVAFSPDGTYLATGSADNTVRIWAALTDDERTTVGRHDNAVESIAFSSDGTRLASAGDSTVRIWDVATGEELAVLRHGGYARSVAFSPDGARLASASDDKTVRIWDAFTGRELAVLKHASHAHSVAFSPDGTRLASGSNDKTVRIWDVATAAELNVLEGHDDSVMSVAFGSDGAWLASASEDQAVRIWDSATGVELNILEGHDGWARSVAFSRDGTRLASASHDQTVRVWDASTGSELAVLRHESIVNSVAFSPDGKRLISGTKDGTVHLWAMATCEEVLVLREAKGGVESVAFSPDGTRLAAGGHGWCVRLWDTKPYRVRHEERQAILAAKPAAERSVDELWRGSIDPCSIARQLRADTSLSAPVRRSALNLVLQRASSEATPAPSAEQ